MLVAGKIERPLSSKMTVFAISILLILIFSKYIYMASLTSYYTFYLIHKFGVTVQASQLEPNIVAQFIDYQILISGII